MIYNKIDAIVLIGHLCNDLNKARDRKNRLNITDFEDSFHKIIFGAIQNLSLEKDIDMLSGMAISTYIKNFPIQYQIFEKCKGIEFIEKAKEKSLEFSYDKTFDNFKKMSLLRKFKNIGMDVSEIWNEEEIDVVKIENQYRLIESKSLDEIKHFFKKKFLEVENQFKTAKDISEFEAKDDIRDLINRLSVGQSWGKGFMCEYFNTIFRGMLLKKLILRSGGSGSGKTRQSVGDMCKLSAKEYFDLKQNKWIVNKNPVPSFLISTELEKEEIQTMMLATICGINEEIIKNGNYSEMVTKRLAKGIEILENSKMFCEFNSNFCIDDIENSIEENVIRNGVKFVFFDYLQVTSNLSQELTKMFGYVLREDQMLNQLATCLKNLCNRMNIFLLTGTQLNRSYKTDGYIDATHLRGGMATLDKFDGGIITVQATQADLDKLKPYIEKGFGKKPTHAHHIIKNRYGKWTHIICWVDMDLDTISIREHCFCTTQDYEYLPIQPTKIL